MSDPATLVSATSVTVIVLQSDADVAGMSPDNTGKPFDWGFVQVGANISFDLTVEQAGTYALDVSYASPYQGTGADMLVDGAAAASVAFDDTGGWGA